MWSETLSATMIQNMASNGCEHSLSKKMGFFYPRKPKSGIEVSYFCGVRSENRNDLPVYLQKININHI